MSPPRPLHLLGPGRAGTSLARILQLRGWAVHSLSGGGEEGVLEARSVLGGEVSHGAGPGALPEGVLLLVAVPDDVLPAVLRDLAGDSLPREALVAHLSGSLGLEVFPGAWPESVGRGALHPLRSFPTRDPGAADLGGCLVACEGAREQDLALLEEVARGAGGHPVRLPPEGRALYHLGASLAGNALLALLGLAVECFRAAGVPETEARRGLALLAQGALGNARSLGAGAALTGPVVRGDTGVLQRHLAALAKELPRARELYLGLVAEQLVCASGRMPEDAARRVARWLAEQRS